MKGQMKNPKVMRFWKLISQEIHKALAPTGTLRAGINLSNFLLVSGFNADGAPEGVSAWRTSLDVRRTFAFLRLIHASAPAVTIA